MTDVSKTVISTRVRLARNLEGYPFPSHLKNERQAKDIIRLVTSGLARLDEFKIYYMDNITEAEALSLKENHLISPNLINRKRIAAALINREESVSIMINEEDHLRAYFFDYFVNLRNYFLFRYSESYLVAYLIYIAFRLTAFAVNTADGKPQTRHIFYYARHKSVYCERWQKYHYRSP